MYNLFEQKHANDILNRVQKLQPGTKAQWGKMNVEQMLAHCALTLDTPFGPDRKQIFLGKVFGKMARKSIISAEPFKKNSPSDKTFLVKDARNFETEKNKLVMNIQRFTNSGPQGITCKKHHFFGEFSADDWSFLMHKHLDHHLKQFGV